MPVKPDNPLRKVTLNLYAADCEEMEKRYGHGWSEVVRQWVRRGLKNEGVASEILKKRKRQEKTMTVGDLLAGDE